MNEKLDEGIAAMRAAGLPLHEEVRATQDLEMLGVRQVGDPPSVRLSASRHMKLWRALGYLTEVRRQASSKQLEKLLGHWIYAALLRRCILSAARSCYDFCRAGYLVEAPLWPSVLSELRAMMGFACSLQS